MKGSKALPPLVNSRKTAKIAAPPIPYATGRSMTDKPTVAFAKFAAPKKGSVIVLAPEGGELGEAARAADPAGVLPKAFAAAEFKGKLAAALEVLAPAFRRGRREA
jgi:hypothetical protein